MCLCLALGLSSTAWGQGAPTEASEGSSPADGIETEEDGTPTAERVDGLVERMAREANGLGLEHLEAERYPQAFRAFEQAYQLDPLDPEIVHNFAVTLHRLGNLDRAKALFEEALALSPESPSVHQDFSDLLIETGDDLARAWQVLERLRVLAGNRPEVLLRQARVAAAMEKFQTAESLYLEVYRESAGALSGAAALEVADFYREFQRDDEALEWYEKAKLFPKTEEEAKRRMWELSVEREAQRHGLGGLRKVIPSRAHSLVARAEHALSDGERARAAELAHEALRIAPNYARAHGILGDVAVEAGKLTDAELAYLRGLAFEPNDAELQSRLAGAYLRGAGGDERKAAVAAVALLERAVQLRPDWIELRLQLAHAFREVGDLPAALGAVNSYLGGLDEGVIPHPSALELRATIEEVFAEGPVTPEATQATGPVVAQIGRARVLLARGDTQGALAALGTIDDSVLDAGLHTAVGRILHAAGRYEEAVGYLENAVKREPERGEFHTALGVALVALAERDGRSAELEARAYDELSRGEELGDGSAAFHRARLTSRELQRESMLALMARLPEVATVRDTLDGFARSSSVHNNEAEALLRRLNDRLWGLVIAALLSALVCLLVTGIWLRRRFGGATLADLISSAPQSVLEIRRVVSSIQHEVLKHNTMVLRGLVEALEAHDVATDNAAVLRSSLVGEHGAKGDDGAWGRLREYERQLRNVGRAHEVRLNLRHRDEALSPIHRGFEMIVGLAGDLDRIDNLGERRRRRVLDRLRRASFLLNDVGYRAIRRLLERIRSLEVTEALLVETFERIRHEPALAELTVHELQVEGNGCLPAPVGVPRAHFEDILGNLFRNAIQSSRRDSSGVWVGVGVRTSVDPITAVEHIDFCVRDRSIERLDEQMLKRSRMEGGLGITLDLIHRYDGTLRVLEDEAPWKKSVVVRLPRKEESAKSGDDA